MKLTQLLLFCFVVCSNFPFGSVSGSASVPALSNLAPMTTDSGSFVFGSGSAIENSRVFPLKRRIQKIKQRCHIGPQLHRNDAPESVQARADFDTKVPTFSFGICTSASPGNPLTNVAPGTFFGSSSPELLSQTKPDPEKENMSCMGSSFPGAVKQNKATREADKEPVKNSPLPLTTVSRIWNNIPQNPHFYQLRNCSELVRNNLISAWDQIFEETVREIHSLQDVDFWFRAKKLWKTMEDLQNVGYNVIPLRKRLVELTDVMMELRLSQHEIKGLKIKAENHRMEKTRLESLIVNLQAMAKKEEESMESLLIEAAKLENDLPKFGGFFTKLAMEPF